MGLERINMPKIIIDYAMSMLKKAEHCIITKYEPTELYEIEKSMRQGDCLSPLIYHISVAEGVNTSDTSNHYLNNRFKLPLTILLEGNLRIGRMYTTLQPYLYIFL